MAAWFLSMAAWFLSVDLLDPEAVELIRGSLP
jgi:hypothetical protein